MFVVIQAAPVLLPTRRRVGDGSVSRSSSIPSFSSIVLANTHPEQRTTGTYATACERLVKPGKLEWGDDSSDEYLEEPRRQPKRRKVEASEIAQYGRAKNIPAIFLMPLPALFGAPAKPSSAEEDSASRQAATIAFEDRISPLLSELKVARQHQIDREGLVGVQGASLRPLRRHEADALLERKEILAPEPVYANGQTSPLMRRVALRKLSLERQRRRAGISGPSFSLPGHPPSPSKAEEDPSPAEHTDHKPTAALHSFTSVPSLSPLPNPLPTLPPPPGVIASLNAIRTTPFTRSFLSRIVGSGEYGVARQHGGAATLGAVPS